MGGNPEKQDKQVVEKKLILSQSSTTCADVIHMARRKDLTVLLQFVTTLDNPDVMIENSRVIVTENTARSLVDKLAEILNHYPEKPKDKSKKAK